MGKILQFDKDEDGHSLTLTNSLIPSLLSQLSQTREIQHRQIVVESKKLLFFGHFSLNRNIIYKLRLQT